MRYFLFTILLLCQCSFANDNVFGLQISKDNILDVEAKYGTLIYVRDLKYSRNNFSCTSFDLN